MSEITKHQTPFWGRLRKFWVDLENRLFGKLTKRKVSKKIKAKYLSELLSELGACSSAMRWQEGKGIERAVAECPNADWLLWLALRVGVDERLLYKSVGYMLESIRWMYPDYLGREINNACLKAIDAMISDDQSFERSALSHAQDVIWRHSNDIWCALKSKYIAVLKATRFAELPYVAASVALAQMDFYVTDYAKELIRKKSLANSADICREHVGQAIIEKVNERMLERMR